jgi:hypothetical protein
MYREEKNQRKEIYGRKERRKEGRKDKSILRGVLVFCSGCVGV